MAYIIIIIYYIYSALPLARDLYSALPLVRNQWGIGCHFGRQTLSDCVIVVQWGPQVSCWFNILYLPALFTSYSQENAPLMEREMDIVNQFPHSQIKQGLPPFTWQTTGITSFHMTDNRDYLLSHDRLVVHLLLKHNVFNLIQNGINFMLIFTNRGLVDVQ
jgi:hypothetical protein